MKKTNTMQTLQLNEFTQIELNSKLEQLEILLAAENADQWLQFYREMHELMSPEQQSQRRQELNQRRIQTVYRLAGEMQILMFDNGCLLALTAEAHRMISGLNNVPVSHERICQLYLNLHAERFSFDRYLHTQPRYADLLRGELYSQQDITNDLAYSLGQSTAQSESALEMELSQSLNWHEDYFYMMLAHYHQNHHKDGDGSHVAPQPPGVLQEESAEYQANTKRQMG